jgi:methionine-S-sulfoxide reductase
MGAGPTKEFGPAAVAILQKKKPPVASTSSASHSVQFAAGCFWGVELAFQRVPGVLKTQVGYTQGVTKDPTYEEVCSGASGHAEAVLVEYQPERVSIGELLTVFWDIHDPTTPNRQGNDAGTQYRSGIYCSTEEQKAAAISSREQEQQKYGNLPIVTEILMASKWYPAEEYHQQYLEKGGQCSLTGDLTPIRCYG